MGLFDFLRNKSQPIIEKSEEKTISKKSDNVRYLNEIQKEVFQYLKTLGFKKKGRTFNRQSENGVWQVINFQSGQFPVGDNYVIPGVRESFYGKFTVNLGVIVKELALDKEKVFFQEYDCQIRTRLCQLTKGEDVWWAITEDNANISNEIIKGLSQCHLFWDFVAVCLIVLYIRRSPM